MKELITISALSLLLAAGCASRGTSRGGGEDTMSTSPDYNTGAVHPGTTLGTNPSEDAPPVSPPSSGTDYNQPSPKGGSPAPGTGSDSGAGSSLGPDLGSNPGEASPDGEVEPSPDETTPGSVNPDDSNSDNRPQGDGSHGRSLNQEGPGMFNLHRTILMIPI